MAKPRMPAANPHSTMNGPRISTPMSARNVPLQHRRPAAAKLRAETVVQGIAKRQSK